MWLIDTSPDLRSKLIDADVKRLDAIPTPIPCRPTHGVETWRARIMNGGAFRPIWTTRRAVVTAKFAYIFRTAAGQFFTHRC